MLFISIQSIVSVNFCIWLDYHSQVLKNKTQEDFQIKINALEDEFQKLKIENDKTNLEYKDLWAKYTRLKDDLQKITTDHDDSNRIKFEYKDLQTRYNVLIEDFQRCENEKIKSNLAFNNLQVSFEALNNNLQGCKNELERLKSQIQDIRNKKKKMIKSVPRRIQLRVLRTVKLYTRSVCVCVCHQFYTSDQKCSYIISFNNHCTFWIHVSFYVAMPCRGCIIKNCNISS